MGECPDGSYVSRDPTTCDFDPCPKVGKECPTDVKECPDGSYVSRDPTTCKFDSCPKVGKVCPTDVKECPDGSTVSRNPLLRCRFNPCKSWLRIPKMPKIP